MDDSDDRFTIPHRPTRIAYDKHPLRDEDGAIVTDSEGEPQMAGGGSTIKGYTRFDLTSDAYDRDRVATAVATADDWGPYILSEWEQYNHLVFDETEHCPFEVRVLPERVAIDVKESTTSDSVRQFVTRLTDRVDIEFAVTRDTERLAP